MIKPSLFILLVIVLLTYCQHIKEEETAFQKPNIVFIIADDLGWADVGYNGNDFYETPNIDRLAKEGMVFNNFYPSAANCAPSRAGILTGMYSPRHHVYLPQGYARPGPIKKKRWKLPTHGEGSMWSDFVSNSKDSWGVNAPDGFRFIEENNISGHCLLSIPTQSIPLFQFKVYQVSEAKCTIYSE
jgi:hypothetical protein